MCVAPTRSAFTAAHFIRECAAGPDALCPLLLQKCSEEEFNESREVLSEPFQKQSEVAAGGSGESTSNLDVMARWLSELERKVAVKERQVGASREELQAEKAEHDKWLKKRTDELLHLDHTYA